MNKEIIKKLNLVLGDLEMLKAGTWVPDDESCRLFRRFLDRR